MRQKSKAPMAAAHGQRERMEVSVGRQMDTSRSVPIARTSAPSGGSCISSEHPSISLSTIAPVPPLRRRRRLARH